MYDGLYYGKYTFGSWGLLESSATKSRISASLKAQLYDHQLGGLYSLQRGRDKHAILLSVVEGACSPDACRGIGSFTEQNFSSRVLYYFLEEF